MIGPQVKRDPNVRRETDTKVRVTVPTVSTDWE